MSAATRVTPKKRKEFLKRIARHGNVTAAALATGINRVSWYRHRQKDPVFAAAWEDAVQQAADTMLLEARRRAVWGTRKPVFYRGAVCGHIREYSDTLLMFIIKGLRPEYATERPEVSDRDGAPIAPPKVVIDFLDAKERALCNKIAEQMLMAEVLEDTEAGDTEDPD